MNGRAMIEYRCDRCQRLIEQSTELRYIVRIEVQAALEPLARHVADEERDYLHEISEQLDGVSSAAERPRPVDDCFEQSRYDLCGECFQAFRTQPLGVQLEPGTLPSDDSLPASNSAAAEEIASAPSQRRRPSDLHHN